MKKLTLAGLIALLSLTCCNRRYSGHYHKPVPIIDSTQEFINAARSFMEQHETTAPPVTDSPTYTRTSLHKTPRWGLARIQYFSFGRGVVVPVNIAEPLGIKVGPHQVPVSASSITWLLLYQDSAKLWHPEVITRLPNDTTNGPFRGKVRVEDWLGHFLKAFLYMANTSLFLAASRTIQRPIYQRGYAKMLSCYAAMKRICTTTDWYVCHTYDGVFAGCHYAYSTEECSVNDGSGGEGVSTITPSAYDRLRHSGREWGLRQLRNGDR
jgi:hypothetical protein